MNCRGFIIKFTSKFIFTDCLDLKMGLIKGYTRIKTSYTVILSSLIFLVGLINFGIPESSANFCPDSKIVEYPVDFFNVNTNDFRTLGIKKDFPVRPFTHKTPQHNKTSKPLSDQCYFKEGHRVIADKGPETALLVLSGTYSEYPVNPITFISHLPFVAFSSWNGNSLKIRPPPIDINRNPRIVS